MNIETYEKWINRQNKILCVFSAIAILTLFAVVVDIEFAAFIVAICVGITILGKVFAGICGYFYVRENYKTVIYETSSAENSHNPTDKEIHNKRARWKLEQLRSEHPIITRYMEKKVNG